MPFRSRWCPRLSCCRARPGPRSEEHTSELQSPCNIVCRFLLEKKKAEPALLLNARRPPIIFFCDAITGGFPGVDIGQQVFLVNEVAWRVCHGFFLNVRRTTDDSHFPQTYGLLI